MTAKQRRATDGGEPRSASSVFAAYNFATLFTGHDPPGGEDR
jgi:hypothetical protein